MNLFENILAPKAKLAFSQTGQAIGNTFQPVVNSGNQVIQQNKQAIQPAVQKVTQVATKMAEPIIKPIQRNNKIAKVNSFLADKGLTVEHIRTLAEMDGTNPDEAIKALQDMGIKVKGMDEIVATQKAQAEQQAKGILGSDANRSGFLQQTAGVGADIIGGAASEVPSFLGNTASFINKASQYNPATYIGGQLSDVITSPFSDKTYGELRTERAQANEGLSKTFQNVGQKGKELVQSTGLYDPTTLSAKGGELVTDIAGSLIGPNKVGILKKGADAYKLGKKLTMGAKIGDIALEGGLAGAKFDVGTKGKITPESVAMGAVGNVGIAGLGKVISKGGELVKKSGKALYNTAIKPNVQEAEKLINAEATTLANKAKIKKIQASNLSDTAKAKKIVELTGKAPIIRADTGLKYGITGTEKGIGVKGKAESSKLWNETIGPAIGKSKAQHNIDDMFAKAEKVIEGEKSALRKQELMEGLEALKEDFASTGKKIFTTGDLQAEKSLLDEFTPTKIWKGKEVMQGYTQMKNTLANIFREQVREDLGKVGVKNAKELYGDYANLSALRDIGVKGITEGGLKGGFGTFWSTVYDKIATPIKTVGGKYIYKLGNGMEYVGPEGMNTLGKYLKSKGYKFAGGNIIKLSGNVNPTLIRVPVISSSSNSGMDMTPIKPPKR